jgi:hypothetical protein
MLQTPSNLISYFSLSFFSNFPSPQVQSPCCIYYESSGPSEEAACYWTIRKSILNFLVHTQLWLFWPVPLQQKVQDLTCFVQVLCISCRNFFALTNNGDAMFILLFRHTQLNFMKYLLFWEPAALRTLSYNLFWVHVGKLCVLILTHIKPK